MASVSKCWAFGTTDNEIAIFERFPKQQLSDTRKKLRQCIPLLTVVAIETTQNEQSKITFRQRESVKNPSRQRYHKLWNTVATWRRKGENEEKVLLLIHAPFRNGLCWMLTVNRNHNTHLKKQTASAMGRCYKRKRNDTFRKCYKEMFISKRCLCMAFQRQLMVLNHWNPLFRRKWSLESLELWSKQREYKAMKSVSVFAWRQHKVSLTCDHTLRAMF